MTCSVCKHEVYHVFCSAPTYDPKCKDCKDILPSRILAGVTHYWEDGKGSITSAHLDDIKHRFYDGRTGEVKRDTGRKYI